MKIVYEMSDLIYTCLCMTVFIGIFIIFQSDFSAAIMRIKMRRRLNVRRKMLEEENSIKRHLDLVVKTAFAGKKKNGFGSKLSSRLNGNHLIAVSGIVAAVFTVTAVRSYSAATAVIFGIITGAMPYVFLRIRLENIRHKASFEGESFAALLLSKYRLASLDMQKTIEFLAEDENTPPVCKKTLTSVLMKARLCGDRDEIKNVFKAFEFTVGTNWARMASYNMALAFAEGIDVSSALQDLIQQIAEARKLAEERKRLNSEAGRLVIFMVPVSYVVSLILAVKYVGIDFSKLMANQFTTPQGFAFFIVIFFLFLINLMILKTVENRRFDY